MSLWQRNWAATPGARSARPLAALALVLALLGFGGCAQSPEQVAETRHGKEYFPSSVYGPASRRVIADGQPVPRGGGQYLVGKPYTVAGQTYYPSERRITQVGLASWYGDAFHGRLTANGEVYDRDGFTAAHPTMPLPSYARVTNLRNNVSMIVRVNDRGPYHANRIMDVSRRVAEALDFQRGGTSQVRVEYVARASLAGSDDAQLLATLRRGGPAHLPGETLVAEAPSPARVASLAPEAPRPAAEPPRRPARADQHPASGPPSFGPSHASSAALAGSHGGQGRAGEGVRHAAGELPAPKRGTPRIDPRAEAQLARLAAAAPPRALTPPPRPTRVAALASPVHRLPPPAHATRLHDD